MMMKRDEPDWWRRKYTEQAAAMKSMNFKPISHSKRLRAVCNRLHESDRVLDLGCGLGLVNVLFGPFKTYVGVDFCKELIEEASLYVEGKFHEGDLRNLKGSWMSNYHDWALMIGVVSIKELWEGVNLFDFLVKMLNAVEKGVIVWWPWDRYERADDCPIAVYSIDDVVSKLYARGVRNVEVMCTDLIHEFGTVIR